MYAGGGKLIDLLGTRVGYAVMILWWSVATFAQGLAQGVLGLGIARVMLGLGEGGGFPGAAKAVSEWFPPQERALAFGIFTAGSSIGPTIAVPLVAGIILVLNWRWVFFITGIVGFVWLVAWWLLDDLPEKHKRITPEERDYILSSRISAPGATGEATQPRIAWTELFRHRQLWGIILPKFFTDAAWFFLIFWLPKYLGEVRHLDIKAIAYYAWIPYAVSGVGCVAGGWLSGYLIRRGFTLDHARKIALAVGAALVPASILITKSPLNMVIVLFSLALFGHQFWSTILQTLAADMFPSSAVGSVAGLMGSIGSIGAMLFNLLAGILLSHFPAYPVLFATVALLYPLSLAIIWLVVRKIEPLRFPTLGTEGQTVQI
jgi:ACS family hexuronate transporter-like MFS transporter